MPSEPGPPRASDPQPKTTGGRANVPAELKDADGQVLSIGLANLFPDDNSATFRPMPETRNPDNSHMRADILFLTVTKECFGVKRMRPCSGSIGDPLHYDLKLKP